MESNETSTLASFDLTEPSQEVLDWANNHLGENPDKKYQIISEFRDLIYQRGECIPHKSDDEYLLRFLRARRFNLQNAHDLIVNYYEFKENNPQYCENIDLANLVKVIDSQILSIPPYRAADGRRVSFFSLEAWNPEEITVNEILQTCILLAHELGALEPKTQIFGTICVFDLQGFSQKHLRYLTPTFAQKLVEILATSCPVRIFALHVINEPTAFDIFYRIFNIFLNKNMTKRIFFHGNDMASLHKYINPEDLPTKYGGKQVIQSAASWIDILQQERQVIDELKALGYRYSGLEDLYS